MGQKNNISKCPAAMYVYFLFKIFISHQSVELLTASQPTVRFANANIAKKTDSMESLS